MGTRANTTSRVVARRVVHRAEMRWQRRSATISEDVLAAHHWYGRVAEGGGLKNMDAGKPRLAIQEQRRLIRVGLADMVERSGSIDVVAAVPDDVELVRITSDTTPDAVALELDAPWDTRALVGSLREIAPKLRVVAL